MLETAASNCKVMLEQAKYGKSSKKPQIIRQSGDTYFTSSCYLWFRQPILTQSAWFRPHNRSEDIPNLYLVGAGTHPGAGLPGVMSSGKIVAQMIGV